MAAIDAHKLGRTRNVALGLIQFALNEFAMIRIAGFLERRKAIRRCRRLGFTKGRKVFGRNAMISMHDHDALDGVTQLAHIARP